MRDLIRYYSREAGVRNLERELANLARKAVKEIVTKKTPKVAITRKNLEKFAGVKKYRFGETEAEDMVGVVTGLAWTEVGGEILTIARNRRVTRPPPLVVLCDISGSMSRYAQILLHFLHAVTNDRDRVSVFLFGTRLSNVTRQLKARDPEVAFQMVAHAVPDWSGGTRIGEAVASFNHLWAKRVLGQGAVVLLITDGLDRDGAHGLAENMDRLHRSCTRLIWLNPLLRWSGFEPKSQGIKAMLPHVDEFRPVHNLASLRSLIDLLSRPAPMKGTQR
ncbi:Lon protease [mine drainage metagenome]|uniref:Lon protease n=1 Tax=mine drainage metagenome TaxID=410659 RepID=A0A1J5PWV2_9ZZZZ